MALSGMKFECRPQDIVSVGPYAKERTSFETKALLHKCYFVHLNNVTASILFSNAQFFHTLTAFNEL